MIPDLRDPKQDLCNLLKYAEELLKVTERVVHDLSADAIIAFHEHDVAGLQGVTVGRSEEAWLRVARLSETPPPEPGAQFNGWLVRQPASRLFDPPALLERRTLTLPAEDVSDLIEGGLARIEDVAGNEGAAEPPASIDVTLRLAKLPEFAAAFAAYVAGPWSSWAETEKPRRRSVTFYNRLFDIQQRMVAMGDDTPVECVIGVGVARWQHPAQRINAPLIEALVEIELDEATGTIIVQPRPRPPKLCLRAFETLDIASVGGLLRDGGAQLERSFEDPDVGFAPTDKRGFEHVLRMCRARLSEAAVYEPDERQDVQDRSPPAFDDKLRIMDSWVFYARRRSADFRCADIEALIKRVREQPDGNGLPQAAVSFVTRPQATPLEPDDDPFGGPAILPGEPLQPGARWRGLSASAGAGLPTPEPRRFFPLPYNDEQIRTVRRLDDDAVHGVVVQGPPGTGKTHTIANIICHYMATGRRVLVSARTPEALSAIQQKLPAEVRDLAIAIIQSDREGARQLETAVDILSSQVKQIDRAAYRRLLSDLEEKLARVQGELASIDRRIAEHAALNLTEVMYRGQRYVPMALAAVVEDERAAHAWFPDPLDMEEWFVARFEAADIAEARTIRAALGADIVYPSGQLPRADALPDVPRLLAAHHALAREQVSKDREESGELPRVSTGGATTDDARSLLEWLDRFGEWRADVAQDDWIVDLYRMLLGARHADPAAEAAMRALCQEWVGLAFAGRQFALRGVETPGVEPGNPPFDAAIDALANGRKPFGVLAFGKSSLKARIDAVRVEARAPGDAAAWGLARDYRAWQKRAHGFLGRWSAAAAAVGFPPLPPAWPDGGPELLRLGRLVERMHDLHLQAADRMRVLGALFPFGVDARRVVLDGEIGAVREALACHLEQQGGTDARDIARRLASMPADAALPFHAALNEVRAALGSPAVEPRQLAEGWQRILAEARRLHGLRPLRERLEAIAGSVAACGAPRWATRLLLDCPDPSDALTPASWPQTWEWARAAGYVRRISCRGTVADLSVRHAALEREQRAVMGDMVRVTTFLGLKRGITAGMASALARFSLAVRELGAGTGKSANRRRRAIREAALEAAAAVPCWILPEWRVAEQLPSELGTFDLVIIDEASQSDITALPVVMRGRKLLVVGDDKQVSPSGVAIEEAFVIRLRETFLRGTVLETALEPTTSLYDIAAITMPGAVILLREHFRCVEPLIRYSSKLYPKALIPLRVPTAAERLDPPARRHLRRRRPARARCQPRRGGRRRRRDQAPDRRPRLRRALDGRDLADRRQAGQAHPGSPGGGGRHRGDDAAPIDVRQRRDVPGPGTRHHVPLDGGVPADAAGADRQEHPAALQRGDVAGARPPLPRAVGHGVDAGAERPQARRDRAFPRAHGRRRHAAGDACAGCVRLAVRARRRRPPAAARLPAAAAGRGRRLSHRFRGGRRHQSARGGTRRRHVSRPRPVGRRPASPARARTHGLGVLALLGFALARRPRGLPRRSAGHVAAAWHPAVGRRRAVADGVDRAPHRQGLG